MNRTGVGYDFNEHNDGPLIPTIQQVFFIAL